jgi:hypothetical protein
MLIVCIQPRNVYSTYRLRLIYTYPIVWIRRTREPILIHN